MSGELHAAEDGVRLEYYSAVLDAIKRYIQDGHALALHTEIEDGRTRVTFAFESGALSPYMQDLEHSQDGASSMYRGLGSDA